MAILINTNPSPLEGIQLTSSVNLDTNTAGSTFLWEIWDQPEGVADTLDNPNIQTPILIPNKVGTYGLKVTIDGSVEEYGYFAVNTLRSETRIPASGEGDDNNGGPLAGVRSWATSLEKLFKFNDKYTSRHTIDVCINDSGGNLEEGDVVRVKSGAVIAGGTLELDSMSTIEKASAASVSTLGVVGIVGKSLSGGSTTSDGSKCLVVYGGLIDADMTGYTIGDKVFVSDTLGEFSSSEGTVKSVLGECVIVGASGQMYVHALPTFVTDGLAKKDGTPALNQIGVWANGGAIAGSSSFSLLSSVLFLDLDQNASTGFTSQNTNVNPLAVSRISNIAENASLGVEAYSGAAVGTLFGLSKADAVVSKVTSGTSRWMLNTEAAIPMYFGTNNALALTVDATQNIKVEKTFNFGEIAAPAVSPSGESRLYMDSTSKTLKVSEDGGAYVNVVGGGGGDVFKVGTPVDNQVGIWTGDGTIEGTTEVTYDGSSFLVSKSNITFTRFRVENPNTTNGAKAEYTGTSENANFFLTAHSDATSSTKFGVSRSSAIEFGTGSAGTGPFFLYTSNAASAMYLGTADTLALTVDTSQNIKVENSQLQIGSSTTSGFVLTTDASGVGTWQASTAGGDVSKVGTPVDNQVGVWTGDGTIEGTGALTYTSNNFLVEVDTNGLSSLEVRNPNGGSSSRSSLGVFNENSGLFIQAYSSTHTQQNMGVPVANGTRIGTLGGALGPLLIYTGSSAAPMHLGTGNTIGITIDTSQNVHIGSTAVTGGPKLKVSAVASGSHELLIANGFNTTSSSAELTLTQSNGPATSLASYQSSHTNTTFRGYTVLSSAGSSTNGVMIYNDEVSDKLIHHYGTGTNFVSTSGNFGVGNFGLTDVPQDRLHVRTNSSVASLIKITGNGGGHTASDGIDIGIEATTGIAVFNQNNPRDIKFQSEGTSFMYHDQSTGRTGFGTETPLSPHEFRGSVTGVVQVVQETAVTTGDIPALIVKTETSGTAADGLGAGIFFRLGDVGDPQGGYLGSITCVRDTHFYKGKMVFKTNGTPIGTRIESFHINNLQNVVYARRVQESTHGSTIASAGDITLGTDGNSFQITGTATINRISATDWQDGSLITLQFAGAATLAVGASVFGSLYPIRTQSGSNLVVVADTAVNLRLVGTTWYVV